MSDTLEAHFWFAPGVEVFAATRVPNPPPRDFRIAVREPLCVALLRDFHPEDVAPAPQIADFRLTDWSPSGEVAHYTLEPRPRAGWRWLAVNGSIHAEKK